VLELVLDDDLDVPVDAKESAAPATPRQPRKCPFGRESRFGRRGGLGMWRDIQRRRFRSPCHHEHEPPVALVLMIRHDDAGAHACRTESKRIESGSQPPCPWRAASESRRAARTVGQVAVAGDADVGPR
jgi:hypothetical protein